ncbi:MAG: hypothetical protein EOP05_19375, partial [Proteobacteria bacterium]
MQNDVNAKTTKLSVTALATPVYHAGESLTDFILAALGRLSLEGKILAVTSKIVSLAEGAVVEKSQTTKKELILKEA